ncbi:MAG: response regulator transcription factor [Planctomycetes bacterium]|nr:response regulator transcription factor [Planctomycetota bacterium]
MSVQILVADDHQVVRSGLRSLLEGTEFQISAEAINGEEAVRMAARQKPDIVLLDIRMPDVDGLAALGQLRSAHPDLPIIMLSTYDNPTYVARAVALGANGYMLKGFSREELINTLRKVSSGEDAWTRDELRRITGALATPRMAGEVDVPLTQRESEVLRQLALGLTNKEIGKALGISYETVKEHVQHILRKIGVTDRTQAAVWAVRKGLV